jgi:hypothetical protein
MEGMNNVLDGVVSDDVGGTGCGASDGCSNCNTHPCGQDPS